MRVAELLDAPEINLNEIQLGLIHILHRQRDLGKLDEVDDWRDLLLLRVLEHYAPHVIYRAIVSDN